ncbi:hypothetical protein B0H17DRAFT_832383, partial [Mycena rosella]
QEAAPRRKLLDIQFRILFAGKANTGKTSILQRVCETTEISEIYRIKVIDGAQTPEKRGQHTISDELIFANNMGYIFHDSCRFESGSANKL